jgi:hypothetical protein
MSRYVVQLQQLNSIPLAVIRRQARAAELSRLLLECCGLVWNAVRAPRRLRPVATSRFIGMGPFGWQREWNADPSQIRTDIFYQLAPG